MSKAEDFVIENGVLKKYNGNDAEVTIPNGVKSIGKSVFFRCKSLTEVFIPDGVKEIGDSAFSSCHALCNVHIADTVESIGNNSFRNCIALTEVHLPNSLTSVGENTFRTCKSLRKINIPESLKSIGYAAFYDCHSLCEIEVFCDNPCCTHLVLDYSKAMIICRKDKLICFPSGYALYDDTRYFVPNAFVSYPGAVYGFIEKYGDEPVSADITAEYLLHIKMNWKMYGQRLMRKTSLIPEALKHRVIPLYDALKLADSTENIKLKALLLEYCETASKREKAMLIRKEKIEMEREFGMRPLTAAEYKKMFTLYDIGGNYRLSRCKTDASEVEIPEYVGKKRIIEIGDKAFEHKTVLTAVFIPDSIKSIGHHAFHCCISLKSVTVPSGAKIAPDAFDDCTEVVIRQ